jgi:hypothetical protein
MIKPLDDHSPETLREQRKRFLAGGGIIQQIPNAVTTEQIMGLKELQIRQAKAQLGTKAAARSKPGRASQIVLKRKLEQL